MKGSTGLALILVIVCVLFTGWSFNYSGHAGFVPLVLGVPTTLLAILCLLGEKYPGILKAFEVSLEDVLATAGGADELNSDDMAAGKTPKEEVGLIIRMFLWFGSFAVVLFLAGFYVAIGLFGVLFTRIQGNISWSGVTFITVLGLGFFYFVFEEILGVDLFAGLMFGAHVPPL